MATLEDIARALGTTKGTVSKALNGASDVSENTRKAVLDKAVELGYSKVIRNTSGKIGLFIENMRWEDPQDFGHDIVTGFRKAAVSSGYAVDIIPMDKDMQRNMSYDSYMLLHDYRGAFFLGVSLSDPWMTDFRTCRTPLVIFDGSPQTNPMVTAIGVNNMEAMDLTIAHLKSFGHTRIGYLSAKLGSYVFQQRHDSFLQALRIHGLSADDAAVRTSYKTEDTLKKDLPWLLEQGCTAIVCSHDAIAFAAAQECLALGYDIPGDLSIVGFDDLPQSAHFEPSLTTIRQNRGELGKSAFFAISTQLSQVPLSSMQLHAQLIVRESTGLAKH